MKNFHEIKDIRIKVKRHSRGSGHYIAQNEKIVWSGIHKTIGERRGEYEPEILRRTLRGPQTCVEIDFWSC